MNPTSLSLLDRLKVARPDASDWNRLQGVYLPLIERWLRRVPGLGDESADLAQEVLVVVFRTVPRFDRQREGSFRAWLRQVTAVPGGAFRKLVPATGAPRITTSRMLFAVSAFCWHSR
jgi:hypothetical protein